MVLAQACTPEAVPRERVTVGGLNDRVALDTANRNRAGGRTERGGAVGAAQLVDRGGCAPSVVVVAAVVVVAVVDARAAVLAIVVAVAISARREATISAVAVIRQLPVGLAALPRDRAVIGALRAAGHPDREVVVLGAKRVVAIAHLGPRGLACVAHTEPIRAGELGAALEAVPRRVAIQVVAAVVALGQAA